MNIVTCKTTLRESLACSERVTQISLSLPLSSTKVLLARWLPQQIDNHDAVILCYWLCASVRKPVMSSSQPFQPSSPLSATDGRRRKSRFTYKHFAQLTSYSTSSPLRVVAHVDLDAFYAQCEQVRLGMPEDQPLAVQQWHVSQ